MECSIEFDLAKDLCSSPLFGEFRFLARDEILRVHCCRDFPADALDVIVIRVDLVESSAVTSKVDHGTQLLPAVPNSRIPQTSLALTLAGGSEFVPAFA